MNPESHPVAPQLSVIFPCYNEERRLGPSLRAALEYLEKQSYTYEVLIVDDGSSDRTVKVAHQAAEGNPNVVYLHYEPNQGKGHAVRYGAGSARGQWVLFSDADLSTPLEELEKFLPFLQQGYDVVIGSRALRESELVVHQPWLRERAGRAMNWLIRQLSGMKYADTQCGFKLFSRRAVDGIFPLLQTKRWMFDVEILIIAEKRGYRVREQPVRWHNKDDSRVKLSHLPNIFRELFKIRAYWLRRQPEPVQTTTS